MSPPSTSRRSVSGLILAGGRGRRMGGLDKGLQLLEGRPLVAWVLQRLGPQVSEVLISANRNLDRYALLGCRVVPDASDGFAGPLAGLRRGLAEAACELIAAVPCDTPFLPGDLVARLAAPLQDEHVDVAFACTDSQAHPVICVARKRLQPSLDRFVDAGGRKVDAWYASLNAVKVPFDDEAGAFRNINTPEDLREAQACPDALEHAPQRLPD